MQRRARSSAAAGRELSAELDPLGDAEARGQAFERDPLGAVADDHVAQRRVARGEHRERAQHVGVALAGDEVPDGHDRGGTRACREGARRIGAEVHDLDRARAVGARQPAMPRLLASTSCAAPSPRATASRPPGWRVAV